MEVFITLWCLIGVLVTIAFVTFVIGLLCSFLSLDEYDRFYGTILYAWTIAVALAGVYISNDLMNLGWF